MQGTYWLTVLPETSQLRPKIKAALQGTEKDATIRPRYDTKGAKRAGQTAGRDLRTGIEGETRKSTLGKLLRLDGAKAAGQSAGSNFSSGFKSGTSSIGSSLRSIFSGSGSGGGANLGSIAQSGGMQMGTKFAGAFKTALGAAGIAGGIAAIVGGLKDVTDTGLSYERQMNTLRGVTQATDAEMQALRDTAKGLGTDTSMAGVGTADAAGAMVELAKGGLSVQEAMDAARGTLQLATAGQVSGAEAAKTQSAALNMFQLDASKAAHVADLLANAANASAADIPDLSLALQQGGSAAAGFGMDIDETMQALTMFSKWGINGSDAGTMLKTSLLAITDQGNPAQGAIEQLGLALYDTNGDFVGYTEMMKQVADASTRMTAEQFQAATAVLFGSDAMRASMISANGGAAALDEIGKVLQRDGAAAELAASQMEGLPGVVEGLKNTWEGVKLTLFDVLDGPLQGIGNFVLGLANGDTSMLPDWLVGGFERLGDVGRSVLPALKQGWDYLAPSVKTFVDQMQPIIAEQAPKFMQFARDMAPLVIALGAAIGGALLLVLKVLPPVLSAIGEFQQVLWAISGGAVQAVVGAFKLVGSTAMWLWNNAIKPAWSGIQGAISIGSAVVKGVLGTIKGSIDAVGSAFGWAYDNFIGPMWRNLQTAASMAWAVVSPIWDGIKNGATGAGMAFQALWTAYVSPVWEGIKSAFSAGWSFLGGIFEQMKGGFRGVADFIKGVWTGIGGVVKSALDAVVSAIKGPLRTIGGILANVPTNIGPFEIPGGAAARSLGAKLQGLAKGGTVDGPGGTDNVLAWLTAGEGVVTEGAMARGGAPIVAALNAGWVPPVDMLKAMLPGFATGGTVGPDVSVAEQLAGTAYSQASRFDCSGTVARVINAALGLDGGGLMSTKNARQWLTERGFVEGTGGPGQISVGWYDRGPNPNDGHMAMTLSDGRNAEQGGSNGAFTIGAGASGAGDSQFDNHMYLPQTFSGEGAAGSSSLGSATSGSGGSSRAVQSAQTSLKNAGQSVDDATYRRDRAQARLDKAKAEGKDTTDAQHSLDVANRELADANERRQVAADRLAEAEQNAATATEDASESSDGGFGDLGKSLWDGLLETIGLDGSIFSNPFEWPTVKSIMAGVNVLGSALSGGSDSAGGDSGLLGGIADATGLGDMLTNLNPNADIAAPANAVAPDTTAHGTGGGQPPGPGVYIENAGMKPTDVANVLSAEWNNRTRTTKVH